MFEKEHVHECGIKSESRAFIGTVALHCFAKPESDTPRGAGGLVSGAASKAVVPLVEASR